MNSLHRLAATAAILSLCVFQSSSAQTPPAPGLKDQMRMPWQRGSTDYFRWWEVSGTYKCDLATDCLDIPGGEAAAVPAQPQLKLANGTELVWKGQKSWGEIVSFEEVSGDKDGAIAYAIAYFERPAAGPMRLAIGSTDGVRVWVNGKRVLARDGRRTLTPDEDQVEVDLAKGWSWVLVKAEARSSFTARLLESGAVARRWAEIGPTIIEQQPELFTVRTDVNSARASAPPVEVQVIRPDGAIVFTATAKRGELVSVDAKGWPELPYEVRASTQTPEGLLYTAYLPYFKGNCLELARQLVDEASKADGKTVYGAHIRMLAEMVEDRLGMKVAEAKANPWPKIHSPLMEFVEIRNERRGLAGPIRPGGFVRIAYLDELDGSVQFARAYLPDSYDPAKKWPLVLQLHGFNPANPRYVKWWSVDNRHNGPSTEFANHEQVIYIEPHGRGNTQYAQSGDNDVMRVIAEARRRFSVDEDRVYLTGESMGGFGTWNVGTRHPDVFAALAPVFGGFDYHPHMTEGQLAKLAPIDRFFNEMHSSWSMAENLLNVPVLVLHGEKDAAVKVDWSRWGVKLLQRWGYDVSYHEYPSRDHETLATAGWNGHEATRWLLQRRRDPNPRKVRIRSVELRNASAYWASIEQAASPLEFMEVDAEVVDRNVIRLDTHNVLAIVLRPSAALVDTAQPVKVVWNGVVHELRLTDGALRLASADYQPAALRKNAQVPGGVFTFTGTPFAVVIGTTSKDAAMRALCEQKARAFIDVWRDWQKQEPRVFRDTEMSDADIGKYSLLLIGGPDANRVSAQLAAKLPVRVSHAGFRIDGHDFAARDAVLQMLYPNPRNAGRYVWLIAGNTADGMYHADVSPFNLSEWDYAIADGHFPAFQQSATVQQTNVASGMFDYNWRYSKAFALEGAADIRAKAYHLQPPKAGVSIDSKTVDEFVGRYQLVNGPVAEVIRDGTRVFGRIGGDEVDALPQADGRLYFPKYRIWIEFQRDASGKVTGFVGNGGGGADGDLVATRVE